MSVPSYAQPGASEGDLIITEIMYAPAGTDSDQEYIEVYNTTATSIDLEDWVIVDEDPSGADPRQDDINTSVTVGSGEFAVLCENETPSENGGVSCAYDYANAISHTNSADYVVLKDPTGTEIDRVHYDESGNWPNAVDVSLEYVAGADGDNNSASNWQAATDRTGDFAGQSDGSKGSPNANAPGGALPVELTTFTVAADRSSGVLRWETVSETENAGFEVQHRLLGHDQWTRRGFVEGAGTTTEVQSYRFETDALRAGTHLFRLKQVDLDGSAHYSAPRSVDIRPETALRVSGPNPLPAGRPITVTVQAEGTQRMDVVLFDALGRRVRTMISRTGPVREPIRARMPTTSLASGIYFLRAITPSTTNTRRISIIR